MTTIQIIRTSVLLTALLLAAVLLRIITLDDRGLSQEELVTLCIVNGYPTGVYGELMEQPQIPQEFVRKQLRDKKTYANVVSATISANGNSVFYHLLLSWWTKVFGNTNFSLRFVSLLFGALIVVLGYYFGRQLFNERVGGVSALLICVHPLMLEYSQLARSYMPATFCMLLATYSLYQVSVAKRHEWLHIPLYVLAALSGVLMHYMVIYVLLAHLLLVIFFHGHKKAFLQFGVMGLIVLGLFSLWWFNGGSMAGYGKSLLDTHFEGASEATGLRGLLSWIQVVSHSINSLFGMGRAGALNLAISISLVVLLLVVIALSVLRIGRSPYFRPFMFVFFPVAMSLLLGILGNLFFRDYFLFRTEYLAFAMPYGCFLIAFAVDKIFQSQIKFGNKIFSYTLAGIFIVAMLSSSLYALKNRQEAVAGNDPFAYHNAAHFVEDISLAGDTIVFQNAKEAVLTNIYAHKSLDNRQRIDSTIAAHHIQLRNGILRTTHIIGNH